MEYYARFFDSLELNVTFYRLPKKENFIRWYERTPPSFRFAIKGSRYITHVKRLKNCDEPLENFFDGASGLKEKLEVVLWQLPPALEADLERLDSFCRALKKNKTAAKKRHVFEFRNNSWFRKPVFELLADNNYALCFADSPQLATPRVEIADFDYYRFHGKNDIYHGRYGEADLLREAGPIAYEIENMKNDVYVFFNNDTSGFAVENALSLKRMVNMKVKK